MKRMTDREFFEWIAKKLAWHTRKGVRLNTWKVETSGLAAGGTVTMEFLLFPKPKPVKKYRLPSKKELTALKLGVDYDFDDFE